MNVTLKSKITKKGDLCICLIDNNFPLNDDLILIDERNKNFPAVIKHKHFYKMMNIGEKLDKDNLVPHKFKQIIDNKIDEIKIDLRYNGFNIVYDKSTIVFKHHVKHERKSCLCL